MKALGAVYGSVYGWERPNWFMPNDDYELTSEELNQADPSKVILNKTIRNL